MRRPRAGLVSPLPGGLLTSLSQPKSDLSDFGWEREGRSEGRSDDRKRALAQGLSNVVAEGGKVPLKSIHVVIREGRGRHTMFGGEPGPAFKPAGGG
jgi:phenylpyruvate tautomerase PptA (4-oxalocrotonate tautomerase family)